eukprot:TRINITY_DN5895_c0_g1_i5.p1 TRINITY_DN5895_c0_g1~~TRINITY_DN5895_c0_g1_i5.p1  ORF type:complete len:319 (+),score=-49.54 TRINITY_DN5895_c0_g1_i5:95-958(+)
MFLLPIRDCRMCWLRKRPDFVMTRSIVRTVNFIVFLVSSASAGLIPLHDNHITLPDQLVARVGMYTPKDAADIASPIYVLWSSPTPKSMSYGIEAGSGSFLRLQAQFAVDQTVTGLQGGVSILVLRSDSASWFGLDAKSRTPDLELCCTAALLKAGRCNQLGHVLIRYSPPWGFDYRMGDPVEVFQPFNDDVRREGLDLVCSLPSPVPHTNWLTHSTVSRSHKSHTLSLTCSHSKFASMFQPRGDDLRRDGVDFVCSLRSDVPHTHTLTHSLTHSRIVTHEQSPTSV